MLSLLFMQIATIFGQGIAEEGAVLVLNHGNYDQVLGRYEFVLVDFYASWCSHCIEFAPVYSQIAKQIRSPSLQLAKIECPSNQAICGRYGIRSFPTLILFEEYGKSFTEYPGDRSPKDLTSWLSKKTNKGSVEAKTLDQLKRLQDSQLVSLAFFGESPQSQEFEEFIKYSRQNKHIPAVHTFNQNFANEMRIEVPSIVIYKPFDERKAVLSDGFDVATITRFVAKHSFPMLMNFDLQTAKRIHNGNQPVLYLLQNSRETQGEKQLRLAMSKIRDQILISLANADTKPGLRLMQYFGLGYNQLPKVIAYNPVTDDFRILHDISKEGIITFTSQFVGALPNHKTDL